MSQNYRVYGVADVSKGALQTSEQNQYTLCKGIEMVIKVTILARLALHDLHGVHVVFAEIGLSVCLLITRGAFAIKMNMVARA